MTGTRRILVFGERGQLGRELLAQGAGGSLVPAPGTDITNRDAVLAAVSELEPDAVINCAAYTAVDAAEEHSELAFAVNRDGAANVAAACAQSGARCLHVSTDFVFDGRKSSPYLPGDPVSALGVYGTSKAAGEAAVQEAAPDALIVRTSWVYSRHGSNFVRTMLRLMAAGTPLRVVADQQGCPTWTAGLAAALTAAARRQEPLRGFRHWSDAGQTSWFDFAVTIQTEAIRCGLLASPVEITPVTTEEYGNRTPRPQYSVLDDETIEQELGLLRRPWAAQLRDMLATMTPDEL